jgi:hypothetical protein
MYNSKFVSCIKSNGKVLREFKDTCYVPFGAEYSILLKNLHTVRALVSVTIDGTDVAEGGQFVVEPNREFEITRFIKNNNLNEGNKFKFIERTAGVEKHRGVKMDDGIIRITFQFEKPAPKMVTIKEEDLYDLKKSIRELDRKCGSPQPYWPYPYYPTLRCGTNAVGQARSISTSSPQDGGLGATLMNVSTTSTSISSNAASNVLRSRSGDNVEMYSSTLFDSAPAVMCCASASYEAPVNDAGITVAGSKSTQSFREVEDFPVEAEEHVMVIKLLGETEQGKVVKKAVSVKAKPTCTTCGRVNKATSKFCSDCGTSLEII